MLLHVTWRRWASRTALAMALCAFQAHAALEVNQAPAHDLVAIKGIGPSTRDKIIAARHAGPFRDWADFIARVRGIGPTTASKMSAQGLRVNGQAYSTPASATAALPSTVEWRPMVPRPLEPTR